MSKEMKQNIAQNVQQQFEDNVSSMIGNDGELSMEALDSVAGGYWDQYPGKNQYGGVTKVYVEECRNGSLTNVKNANDLV